MKLIEEIKKDISGAEILADWLGTGEPVHQMVAEARASRCTTGNNGKPCQYNRDPTWLERNAKLPVAHFIRSQIELKNHLKLTVPKESDLHFCSACGCCLAVKVFVPIEHVKGHTSNEVFQKFPDWCWIKAEILASLNQ